MWSWYLTIDVFINSAFGIICIYYVAIIAGQLYTCYIIMYGFSGVFDLDDSDDSMSHGINRFKKTSIVCSLWGP